VVNYLLTFAFFIISSVFGRALLRRQWKDLEFPSLLQEFLFSTATGLGVIALVIFIVGLIHLLYPLMIALVIFAAILFGLESAPDYLPRLWKGIGSIRLPMMAAALFVVLLIIIAGSLHAPLYPVHMHDAMNSHLEAPKVFLRDHAITFHAYINFNNFPMGIDMLYVPFLLLSRPIMSQICTFLFFLMCLGVVYEFGRVYLKSPTIGMLAAVLLCLVPRFVGQFNHPTVDIALTFYISLILLAVAGWIFAGNPKYVHLTGVILGLSLGIKYTGLPFLLIFVVWILIQRLLLESKPVKKTLVQVGLMLLITLIICSPWYIRNIVLFGNPFFPFYDNLFSNILPIGTAKEQKPHLVIDESQMLERYQYGGNWRRSYTFLADLSITDQAGNMQNQLGPLYLAILPLLFIALIGGLGKLIGRYVLRWDIPVDYHLPAWMLLFSMLGYIAYWVFYVGVLHTRYMFPIMPYMALLAAYTIGYVFKINLVSSRHILTILIICIFGFLAVYYFQNIVLKHSVSDLPLLENSRNKYLETRISSYKAVKEANKDKDLNLGPDDIVYGLYCENCRFYANFTLIGGLFGYADHKKFNDNTNSGKELYEHLKSYGCSYLMVDKRRLQQFNQNPWHPMIKLPIDPTFKMHFELISSQGSTDFYKIID